MPLALKILNVVLLLWMFGTVFAIPMRIEMGVPFFGAHLTGIMAILIVVALDFVGPLLFLVGAWFRRAWAPKIAYIYMGIFVLNGLFAFFTIRAELGAMAILIPTIMTLVFMAVIYIYRNYFEV